jgi:hypothetical protein
MQRQVRWVYFQALSPSVPSHIWTFSHHFSIYRFTFDLPVSVSSTWINSGGLRRTSFRIHEKRVTFAIHMLRPENVRN